jgi:hypothetical protein
MAGPHRQKADPVPAIVLALIVGGLLAFVILNGGWALRSLRLRLQDAHQGRPVTLISKQSDDARSACGEYSVSPGKRSWRYLDNRDYTWAEGRAPLASLPPEIAGAYRHCVADNPLGRRAVGGAFVPIQLFIANAWR